MLSFQNEIDEETESVRNMRILASLTRLSRVHVVSLQPHDHDFLDLRDFQSQNPETFQPPPDYEMAQEIRKKEEEELPSYSQAVSDSTTNHMWYSSMQNWIIRDITPIHILSSYKYAQIQKSLPSVKGINSQNTNQPFNSYFSSGDQFSKTTLISFELCTACYLLFLVETERESLKFSHFVEQWKRGKKSRL